MITKKKGMFKRIIFKWVKVILILYVVIGIGLYFLQNAFLFHPTSLKRGYQFHFTVPFKELEMTVGEKDTISVVKFFPHSGAKRGVVVYFHGNMDNIERYAKYADNFTSQGYEVWMEDYPGFGKSVGDRSEKGLYAQALALEQKVSASWDKDSIILYGKSFGTGIAAYVASVAGCKRLILETPYYSIPALFACYAPVYPVSELTDYKIPTFEYVGKVGAPVTIFHGTDDWVVPYHCAAKLKACLKTGDEFITIEKGTHHNLNDFLLFHHKLDSLLK